MGGSVIGAAHFHILSCPDAASALAIGVIVKMLDKALVNKE